MNYNFDQDPIGAILEYAVLIKKYKVNARTQDKINWEKNNIKCTDLYILQPWSGPDEAFAKSTMYKILEHGREIGYVRQQVDWVFRILESNQLIVPYGIDANINTEYRTISDLGRELFETDTYQEYLYGVTKIVERWRDSVVRIVNSEDSGIGTGFVAGPDLIATARHVVDEMPKFIVESETGKKFVHTDIIRHSQASVDLALIRLKKSAKLPSFRISPTYDLLDTVVVFGYPPISRAKDAYLVVNRGEISAQPIVYPDNQRILVVTCLLRGGNSGGPIVNSRGEVVGIVSRQLFRQVSPDEKSINESLGMAAATEAVLLSKMINETRT